LSAFIAMTVQLVSCGNSVEGKYAYEKNPKSTIELKDGKVPSMGGMSFPYEVKNNKVYLKFQGKSIEYAEIIDSDTLKIDNKIYNKVD